MFKSLQFLRVEPAQLLMTRICPLPQPPEGEVGVVGGVGLVGGELGTRDGLLVIGLRADCLVGLSVTGFKEGLEDGTRVGVVLG